ncbi:hypothetical protein PM082_003623 [Marasmius tenuissimus]|nr:hypothetical protein PM082_003623 [Marasmius tenuissimus]
MNVYCKGCFNTFGTRAFHHHIALTTSKLCLEFGQSLRNDIADEPSYPDTQLDSDDIHNDFDGSMPTDLSIHDFDMDFDGEPMVFSGDYLGEEYTMTDLGQGGDNMETEDEEVSQDDVEPEPEENSWPSESDEDDEEGEVNALLEKGWEPVRDGTDCLDTRDQGDSSGSEEGNALRIPESTQRVTIQDGLRRKPFVVKFGGEAGSPLEDYTLEDANTRYGCALGGSENIWHPFTCRMDWEVGRWAKLRGPGSNAFNEFLKIPGVVHALQLSYKTTQELNTIIDTCLPGRPQFRREEVVVGGEAFEFYHRDVLECIQTLWSDTDFTPYLITSPEKHYTDSTKNVRMFHNMHTGKWWWETQKAVEETRPGATIIPLIISTDKTQLTVFGNKTAYPVYMTIGNIPKEIRRKTSRGAYVLLGYLPTSKLTHIKTKAGRRRALANVFHACMSHIMDPLRTAGVDGVVVLDGNGVARRGHPILAVYVADYPEQTMVTTAKGNRCPGLCPTKPSELGHDHKDLPFCGLQEALEVLQTMTEGTAIFNRACKDAGMKPIPEPFWTKLPYTNIFQSMTPDILHQLYQGIIKHLIAWLISIVGADEIDARCRRFPPNHNIRLFMKGISGLSRVTGTEHDQIGRLLLGLIIDIRLPGHSSSASQRLCAAVRGMLDFIYLAQYPLHTTETLVLLREALTRFHDNKQVFVELGVCSDFRIPKLHNLQHYARHFKYFGTSDNYNTQYTERLHIDLAKNAYRSTNHRDEFPQMAEWLTRREKLQRHTKYLQYIASNHATLLPIYNILPGVVFERSLKMAIHPSAKGVKFSCLISDYGAAYFKEALQRYVLSVRDPGLSYRALEQQAPYVNIPFSRVAIWTRVKWTSPDMYSSTENGTIIVDSAHVSAARRGKHGHEVPGRFDTVLVDVNKGETSGLRGYRVGQLRVIFTLRDTQLDEVLSTDVWQEKVPKHLAYIEWFTPLPSRPDGVHGLFKVSKTFNPVDGSVDASIVPVTSIKRTVHLYPKFGPVVPPEWTSSNVLDSATAFYLSCFSDRHAYHTFF